MTASWPASSRFALADITTPSATARERERRARLERALGALTAELYGLTPEARYSCEACQQVRRIRAAGG